MSPMSGKDASELEEANLIFPGSNLVWERLVDEGVGHGFDLWNKSALVSRWYRVEADAVDIHAWYRSQLTSRGWAVGPSSQDGSMDVYVKEGLPRKNFDVVISGRANERPWWAGWPPGAEHLP